MRHKIKIHLSEQGIDRAVKELTRYKEWTERKTQDLVYRLALIGLKEASVRFSGAYYDFDDTRPDLSLEPYGNGFKIVATGEDVCFIEFGTGIYYNGAEPYPSPPGRPPEIAGIGQYGDGKGLRTTWGFYGSDGQVHITHGIPAAMPMYHAAREIEKELLHIAKEVFLGD